MSVPPESSIFEQLSTYVIAAAALVIPAAASFVTAWLKAKTSKLDMARTAVAASEPLPISETEKRTRSISVLQAASLASPTTKTLSSEAAAQLVDQVRADPTTLPPPSPRSTILPPKSPPPSG